MSTSDIVRVTEILRKAGLTVQEANEKKDEELYKYFPCMGSPLRQRLISALRLQRIGWTADIESEVFAVLAPVVLSRRNCGPKTLRQIARVVAAMMKPL